MPQPDTATNGIFTQGGTRIQCLVCGTQWIEPEIDYVPLGDICRPTWERRMRDKPLWKCPMCGELIDRVKAQT
jgi:hypothetical protein